MGTFIAIAVVAVVVCIIYKLATANSKPSSRQTYEAPAARPPQTRRAAAEEGDAWEGSFFEVEQWHKTNRSVSFDYVDGNGNATKRTADLRAFEVHNPIGLVIGHCHLRNATRSFRFDRMRHVVDATTGELLPNLQAELTRDWECSPAPAIEAIFTQHKDVLRMLMYMAKADGAVRAKEVAVIANFCRELTGEARLDVSMVKEFLSFVDVPTTRAFVIAYNRLRREQPDMAKKTADACRAIVAAEKNVHPSEAAALEILDKPLPALSK